MINFIVFPLIYFLFAFIFLISVIGYGRVLKYFFIKNNNFENYKNLEFIFGLIIVGILSVVFNIFFSII